MGYFKMAEAHGAEAVASNRAGGAKNVGVAVVWRRVGGLGGLRWTEMLALVCPWGGLEARRLAPTENQGKPRRLGNLQGM